MKTKIIIGLAFGDEGKGTVTDGLVEKSLNEKGTPLVVRFSGGHNAGHGVLREDGIKHVFSSFGSGTLRDVPTYWHSNCTVYPISLINEYNALIQNGITPTLYIDEQCPITTPYDVYANRCMETKKQHGSVGVGFGTTLKREEAFYSLKAIDLKYPTILKIKLQAIRKYYYELSAAQWDFLIDVDFSNKLEQFENAIKKILSISTIKIVNNIDIVWNKYTDIIFEGSQGLLLDKNIGFYPNVTRCNVNSGVAMDIIKKFNLPMPDVYYVTRCYSTRHGIGPMHHTMDMKLINTSEEINVFNQWQQNFKKGPLSIELLNYAIERDSVNTHRKNNYLVVTCTDQLPADIPVIMSDNVIINMKLLNIIKSININPQFINVYMNNSPCSNTMKSILFECGI
jgi:adenylosuccinate synthase